MMMEQQQRRHSYPFRPEHLQDPLKEKRSASLQPSPNIGFQLGSKVAKQAAKSFWNMDMLKDSLQKIAEYAAVESSSGLGSSIESIDKEEEEEDEDDSLNASSEEYTSLSPIVPDLMDLPFSLNTRSAPSTPTQSLQLSLKRSRSACTERNESAEKQPKTIPRKVSPLNFSPQTAAKVRFQLSNSQILVREGQDLEQRADCAQTPLSPRDDGYHES